MLTLLMSFTPTESVPWAERKDRFGREILSVSNGPSLNFADHRTEQFESLRHLVFTDGTLTHANPLPPTEDNRLVAVPIVKIPLVHGSVDDQRPDPTGFEKRQ